MEYSTLSAMCDQIKNASDGKFKCEVGNDPEPHHDDAHFEEEIAKMIFAVLLVLYLIIGTLMESKKCIFGHETGVIIIIGLIVTFVIEIFDTDQNNIIRNLVLSTDVFFEALLPLIIFATGYNMRRKRFFENIINVNKFGLLGTVITFVVYSSLTLLIFAVRDLKSV